MANNILERLANMDAPDPKRSNFNRSFSNVGTNDFGFLKVKFCEEIIAGSHVTLDFKSAYSTNPTISPVLSKAKVRVTAIWIPTSLYVPALRDDVQIKPGKTDYSFPSVHIDLAQVNSDISESRQFVSENQVLTRPMVGVTTTDVVHMLRGYYGNGMPIVPRGSLMSELGMYSPDFQPGNFRGGTDPRMFYRNMIPLLGYLDFYRTYVANNQDDRIPLRTQNFYPGFDYEYTDVDNGTRIYHIDSSPAVDVVIDRNALDSLFHNVRLIGLDYPANGELFDITSILADSPIWSALYSSWFAPKRCLNAQLYINDESREEFSSFINRNPPVFANDNHFFELRDTYAGDYFTAYLSNQNVEYERSTARVDVGVDGVITMEEIYTAQRVQNYIRRSVFKNNGYKEFIESQYGITPPTNLSRPMFLGSIATDLYWNDVVSQTQTGDDNSIESNMNLGSRAGLGFGRMLTGSYRGNDSKPFVNFTAKEPGYLMLIESIVPDVSYFRNYHPQFDKVSLESLYFPAFDKDGYQDKSFGVLNSSPSSLSKVLERLDWSVYNSAYAQEPAYFEHMASANRMSGQISEEGVYRHWVFTKQQDDFETTIGHYMHEQRSTYVDPELYNSIFANSNGLDNFQTYYDFDFKVYQPMSHRFLSFK